MVALPYLSATCQEGNAKILADHFVKNFFSRHSEFDQAASTPYLD
jgi:hypothetical protein